METSMGIWEAGPTVFVYLPASMETRSDRLTIRAILPNLARFGGAVFLR